MIQIYRRLTSRSIAPIRTILCAITLLLATTLKAQPTITSFTPVSGPANTTVTIAGTNFNATPANNIVYFGAVKANITAATTTSLTVTVPPGATYAPITVTTGNKTAATATPFTVTFTNNGQLDAATVTSVRTIPVYKNFQTIAAGDFDGDGLPDLALCNSVGNFIMIYPNTSAQGQFNLNTVGGVQINTGASPLFLAIGDIDGDGKLDIAVANKSGTVSILLNTSTTGHISFAPKYDFTPPGIPVGVAIGDLDGNGTPDLVITGNENYITGKCYVYTNYSHPGTVGVSLSVTLLTPPLNPSPPSIADIDGDGKPDILFPNLNGGNFSVYLNTGNGYISFQTHPANFGSGNNLTDLATVDIDGDGKPDVAMVNGSDSSVRVYRNTSTVGTASFASPLTVRIAGIPNQVVAGDFDGDGRPDLEAVNSYSLSCLSGCPFVPLNSISLIKNLSTPGNILFNTPAKVVTGKAPMGIVFGDFNADNIADVVVADTTDGTLAFAQYLADTTQALAPTATPSSARAGTTVTITGSNFTGVTTVTFGGVAATSFTVVSSTTITAVVGSGATGNIVIQTASGPVTIPGFTFISPSPTVRSFTPTSGGAGASVTIYGSNFTGATAVDFGDSTAASFRVTSDTSIIAVVGPVIPGSLPISVATPGGVATSQGGVFYTGPVISGFSPQSGPVGTTVTITGAGFNPTAANNVVYFGTEKATVNAVTASAITVTVPTGAAYQPITVTANGLTAFTNAPFSVTFPGAGTVFTPSQFGPSVLNATNRVPLGVTATDLDGDGMVDVAVLNLTDQNISLYRNRGLFNGQVFFHTQVDIGASSGANFLTTGDLTGDGRPEILTTNNNCGVSTISIYKNTSQPGNFSFSAPLSYPTGLSNCSGPNAATITDLDGDGRPDIVIANSDNSITVYHNTSVGGNLSFTGAGNYPVGATGSYSVIAGDIDGDGKPDLAVVATNSNIVTLYRNTSAPGAISLQNAGTVTTGSGPFAAALGDLNGDGKQDLAVVNANDFTVTVFRNTSTTGVISFGDSLTYNIRPSAPKGVVITDIDGDGKPDVAVLNSTPQYVSGTNYYSVIGYKNTSANGGKISLQPGVNFTAGNGIDGIVMADITGDGLPDIVTSNQNDNTFSVMPNWTKAPHIHSFSPLRGGVGTQLTIKGLNFTGATGVLIGTTPVTSFTVNSDSSITAIVSPSYGGNVVVNTANGTATSAFFNFTRLPTVNSYTPATGPQGTTLQLIGSNFDPQAANNTVYLGAVKANVTTATANKLTVQVPAGTSYQPLTVYADSMAAFPVQPFGLSWPGGGFIDSTTFAAHTDYPIEAQSAAFNFADIDGDGFPDLVTTSKISGISVYRNKGRTDTLLYDAPVDIATGSSPASIVVQDMDGDGKPDILVSNLLGNTVSVLRNTSTTGSLSFAAKVDITGSAYPFGFVVTDLDGDGRPDLAVLDGIQNGSFLLYQNNSNIGKLSFTQWVYPYSTGSNPQKIVAGDLDGDGLPDLAIVNSSDGTLALFRNLGGFNFDGIITLPTPYAPKGLAIGDLDGDGKPELAITGSSDHLVAIYPNTCSPGAPLSFGTRVDFPANANTGDIGLGDLDGDGKPDVAVVYPGSNKVSVFKNFSTAGNFSLAPKVDFGTGAYPGQVFIGDLHNAGKNDLAVVNLSSNTVSIYRPQATAHPKPKILSFTPDSAATGQTVAIQGHWLSTVSAVRFGTQPAASFMVVNDTLIKAVVDTGATGSIIVTGTNGADTIAGFRYIPPVVPPPPVPAPPHLISFSPSHAKQGDTVTIIGTNLDSIAAVSFGGVSAQSFTILSASQLRAIVGTGATGKVFVRSNRGALDSLAGFTFDTTAKPPSDTTGPVAPVTPTPGFQLATFTGSVTANQPILQWKALHEQHIAYYGVEHGTDTLHWTTVTLISAKELDSASYKFTDSAGRSGLNFYRLSIVNNAGDSSFSPIVSVQLSGVPATLTLYPNPVRTNSFVVNVPVISSPSQFQLVDMAGNVVTVVPVAPGVFQATVTVTSSMRGVYKVIWRNGNQASYQTVLILK